MHVEPVQTRGTIQSSVARLVVLFTGILCALGALLVAGLESGVISPLPWSSVFAIVAGLGYVMLFVAARSGNGPAVPAKSVRRCITVLVAAASLGTLAGTLSLLLVSWMPLAVAAIVTSTTALISKKLF